MSIRISFILPCYNIEKYIADCLDSILNQNLKESEFEVICVNDCGTDKTRDIIVQYKKQHDNIILIDHEKNRRVGAARNTGFFAAKGEYVWFIDPDDIITQDATSVLLPILDKDDLDFVQFGHDWMTEDKTPIHNPPFNLNCPFETEMMAGVDFIHEYQKRRLSYSDMHSGPFVRVYRRSFLLENGIIYPEVVYYEDQYQALHGLIAAKRMRNINKCFYSYRVIETSYSHAPMSIQKRASQVNMCTGMIRLMRQYDLSKEDIAFVWERYENDLRYFKTHFVLFMPNKERTEFIKLIKNELPELYSYLPDMSWCMAKYPVIYNVLACVFAPSLLWARNSIRALK